jgi:hypothetical protein
MWIAFGEDYDFAGFDLDRLLADDIGKATTFGDHMVRDQMLSTRQDFRQDHFSRRRLGNPGGRCNNVKERRAGKPNRF